MPPDDAPHAPHARHRPREARLQLGEAVLRKRGVSRFDLRDPYHLAVALTWPQFLALLLGLYLGANTVFATLYVLAPGCVANARPHSFEDAFFFSFETLATVGYGEMYPASLYGHLVASVEIVCGLAFTAILTGLTFVRFSRPRSKILYAECPVITRYGGKPTLMLRIGNGRSNMLTDGSASLGVLLREKTAEGHEHRRAFDLPLVRRSLPIFPLTWTLMHVIDEASPLRDLDIVEAGAGAGGSRLFLTVEAYDPTLATTVRDGHVYALACVRVNHRYADMIEVDEDGNAVADFTRISDVEADDDETGRLPDRIVAPSGSS